jgi:glycine/serine hydroxymethyltransferase
VIFERLLEAGFAVNVRALFGRRILRLGTQEITRRGFGSLEVLRTAHFLHEALIRGKTGGLLEELTDLYQTIFYSFDGAEP